MKGTTFGRPRLPTFRTDEEERAFWETHRPGDYLSSALPERVQLSRRIKQRVRDRKKNLALQMEPSRVKEIKMVAQELGVPYQTLIRMCIVERLCCDKVG